MLALSQEHSETNELAVRSALSLLSSLVGPTTKTVLLRDLLQELVDDPRFGSKHALARAIKISPSRLGRAMKGEHSFSVRNCLRLAKETGLPADDILRAANKIEESELIRELYGPAAPRQPQDSFLFNLSEEGRQALRTLMSEMKQMGQPKKKR